MSCVLCCVESCEVCRPMLCVASCVAFCSCVVYWDMNVVTTCDAMHVVSLCCVEFCGAVMCVRLLLFQCGLCLIKSYGNRSPSAVRRSVARTHTKRNSQTAFLKNPLFLATSPVLVQKRVTQRFLRTYPIQGVGSKQPPDQVHSLWRCSHVVHKSSEILLQSVRREPSSVLVVAAREQKISNQKYVHHHAAGPDVIVLSRGCTLQSLR